MTVMTGPIEHRAVNPNESESECSPDREEEIPMPIAMMNGTVNGPVATPPASKESGIKDRSTRQANAKSKP